MGERKEMETQILVEFLSQKRWLGRISMAQSVPNYFMLYAEGDEADLDDNTFELR